MARLLALFCFLLFWLTPSRASGLDIALVGDSHLEGLAPSLSQALVDQGHTVHVIARRGWSCGSFRFAGRMLRRELGHPDLVIVFLGSNVRTFRRSTYQEDMQWVLDQMGAARVVWFGPPHSNSIEDQERHHHSAELLHEFLPSSVVWVDSQADTATLVHSDQLHFTISSYRQWAHSVLEHLIPHL